VRERGSVERRDFEGKGKQTCILELSSSSSCPPRFFAPLPPISCFFRSSSSISCLTAAGMRGLFGLAAPGAALPTAGLEKSARFGERRTRTSKISPSTLEAPAVQLSGLQCNEKQETNAVLQGISVGL